MSKMEVQTVTPKEILLQGIEQAPKAMLQELLDCFLTLKSRYGSQSTASSLPLYRSPSMATPERSALVAESQAFWAGKPLEQLRVAQQPITVTSLQELAVDFWPSDEKADDFLGFLYEQRSMGADA